MKHTLGIDVGTFGSKGVLADETGRIVAQASRDHKMIVPQPGWAEHRADEDWWSSFAHLAQVLLAQSGVDPASIAAVAASAIGPCMLPVDAEGAPLMNGVLYGVDTRATEEIALLNDLIGPDTILARCGNALTSQSVGPKILWLRRQRPALFARTAHVMNAATYLTFRLTGEVVIDHYTAANFSPLYDVTTQDWAADLAEGIIGLDKLPRLLWSNQIAGRITPAAAQETGLAQGTPVLCGTIDAGAEALSVGLQHPGDMMMMYGSTIFVIQRTSARVTDPALWYAPWLFAGEHVSMAGLATSGTLTHWFRDQFAQDLPDDTAFAALAAAAAASPPGARGLLCLPYFSGERTPLHDPHARGAIIGLDLTHTRGDIYRAVLEGIAHASAHVIDTYRAAGQPPTRVLAVGGGVQNEVWLQATSDISGVPQVISRSSVGASLGDAFLAATAVGLARREDIARWNAADRRIEPVAHPAYAKARPLFRALYTQTREIAHALVAP